jgi:flagellar operon protein
MSSSSPINPALLPPGTPPVGAPASGGTPGTQRRETVQGKSFADTLKETGAAQGLQFSKHALARVERRGIALDATTLQRLSEGVSRAAGKGARDSLVLVDGTAFVVSVANHTVITAVGSEHMKDNVFTNIDSAVIA